MKSTFENLKHWLLHRQDSFWYESNSGPEFDMQALLSEIDSFADKFEEQIQ